jgi:hypothetical protein
MEKRKLSFGNYLTGVRINPSEQVDLPDFRVYPNLDVRL